MKRKVDYYVIFNELSGYSWNWFTAYKYFSSKKEAQTFIDEEVKKKPLRFKDCIGPLLLVK